MGLICSWHVIDDGWLADVDPSTWWTWSDVYRDWPDSDVLHGDSHNLEGSLVLGQLCERRSDALRHLLSGELAPVGGYWAWDRSDAYLALITAPTVAECARLLAAISMKQLFDEATWLSASERQGILNDYGAFRDPVEVLDALHALACSFLAATSANEKGILLMYF